MRTRNFLQSHPTVQRMVLSLSGVFIIAGMWRWAVFHLYTLRPEAFASFTSLTTNAFYAIAAIVVFMVTGKLVYDWKNNTVQQTVVTAENILERREHVAKAEAFDDESIQ